MSENTINIFFIILGVLIILISIKHLLIIPLCIGVIVIIQGVWGYIKKNDPKNLEEFIISRFGYKLYTMFFEGYTEKVWGRHPKEISPEWGAQRIKGLSIRKLFYSP